MEFTLLYLPKVGCYIVTHHNLLGTSHLPYHNLPNHITTHHHTIPYHTKGCLSHHTHHAISYRNLSLVYLFFPPNILGYQKLRLHTHTHTHTHA